ncbi:hypothetical protein PCL_00006 [Purpureocillium lilacinum]|uniref:Frequency clock protein n=1 Tax=Purpureocillium lilacinum TaxID=33203 RepID=A0A2U3DPA3_PURLI|nr:hypothetical protein PCL_00006 [Purpureocillium lilacinum]
MQPATTSESSQNGYSTLISTKSDSSSGARLFQQQNHVAALSGRAARHNDSPGDYRGIIDDLSVEIKTLKNELRRYKPTVPRMLRKAKLFEIRVHNFQRGQKKELEATLRDFAANLEDRPDGATHRHMALFKHMTQDHYFRSAPSHATSYPGPHSRPPDSAYASMSSLSTDTSGMSGTSLGRPTTNQNLENPDQPVEHYLHDIPAGLYPLKVAMTDKEKEELVVRRLENLFTGNDGGNISGSRARRSGESPRRKIATNGALGPASDEDKPERLDLVYESTSTTTAEPWGEKTRLNLSQQFCHLQDNSRSTESGPVAGPSNVSTVFLDNCGLGDRSCHGTNSSVKDARHVPEERPTRATDLDPDRIQNLSENLAHIRHFGVVLLESFAEKDPSAPDVHTDAKGWIYLNLLCNMAQVHLINVTGTFVRAAVASISTNLQISPDGSKVRWLRGIGGTKISGNRSKTYAQGSQDTGASGQPKASGSRRSLGSRLLSGDHVHSGTSSKNKPSLGRCLPGVGAVERFHYTPILFKRESSVSLTSFDGTSPSEATENDNINALRSGLRDYGTSYRRKRSHDGTIIYYSGVPFCIDFSGGPRYVLPEGHAASMDQNMQEPVSEPDRSTQCQAGSGWSSSQWPLTDESLQNSYSTPNVHDSSELSCLDAESERSIGTAFETLCPEQQQYPEMPHLEPCGLGGVIAEDRFVVAVTTKRFNDIVKFRHASALITNADAAPPMSRLSNRSGPSAVKIEYVSDSIKTLTPFPLPPPISFFPQGT